MVVYEKIKNPNVPECIIEKEIKKREERSKETVNFFIADTLAKKPKEIFELYYLPSESAYKELKNLKESLNGPFKTNKEKGDVLENRR